MSSIFKNIKVSNEQNTHLLNEYIKYYDWVSSNYTTSGKSAKENYYKLASIKKTIQAISKFTKPIVSGEDLSHIKGIGPKTVQRINEIIQTGTLSEIQDIANLNTSIEQLSEIYGIGPSKASEFFHKYNIKTLDELIEAHNNKTITLTNQMLLGIKYRHTLNINIPRILICSMEIFIQQKLHELDPDFLCVFCGSYRRQKPTSSDIDILVSNKKLTDKSNTHKYLQSALNAISEYIIVDSLTSNSKTNTHYQGFGTFKNIGVNSNVRELVKDTFDIENNIIRIDVICVPHQYFFPAMMHFTGSGEFNKNMRTHAKALGYKMSEYGLFDVKNDKESEIFHSEKEIFEKLLLKYIPPEYR